MAMSKYISEKNFATLAKGNKICFINLLIFVKCMQFNDICRARTLILSFPCGNSSYVAVLIGAEFFFSPQRPCSNTKAIYRSFSLDAINLANRDREMNPHKQNNNCLGKVVESLFPSCNGKCTTGCTTNCDTCNESVMSAVNAQFVRMVLMM